MDYIIHSHLNRLKISLKEDESVNHKTERLIQSANEFGGLDNIGVLLIEKGES